VLVEDLFADKVVFEMLMFVWWVVFSGCGLYLVNVLECYI